MRTISTAQDKVLTASNCALAQHVRVSIKDSGGTFRDLTTYPGVNLVDSVSWQEDIDSPHVTADVVLKREVDSLSLAPLMQASALNRGFNPAASYAALVALRREVKVETSTDAADATAGNWMEVFRGYVDTIDPAGGDTIRIGCRDLGALLMDSFIETERVYALGASGGVPVGMRIWEPSTAYALNEFVIPTDGKRAAQFRFYQCSTAGTSGTTEPAWPSSGTIADGGSLVWTHQAALADTGYAVESVMQEILDDNGLSVTLYTPTSPSWSIRAYKQRREPALEALRNLAIQIGWDVRYKWRSGTGQFELTFFQPDRTKSSPDRTFSSSEYVDVKRLSTDISTIRNAIRVIYPDRTDLDPNGNAKRKVHDETDSTSIAAYGRRFMEIVEDDLSNLDTSTEANTLAEACLADLKDPKAEQDIELSYGFPWAELGDLYRFTANGRHYSANQDWALYSCSHSAADGVIRTTIRTRGQPAVANSRWLEHGAGRGLREAHATAALLSPGGHSVAASNVIGGSKLAITGNPLRKAAQEEFEFHLSTAAGFTPSSSTLVALSASRELALSHLTPGTTYHAAIVPRFRNAGELVRAEKSTEVSFVAGRVSPHHLDSATPLVFLPLNYDFGGQLRAVASFPPDHWEMQTGSWGSSSDAYVSASVVRSGVQSVELLNTAVASAMKSDVFPVSPSARFAMRCAARSTSSGNRGALTVRFYSDAGITEIGSVALTLNLTSADTWEEFQVVDTTGASTKYARIDIGKYDNGTYAVFFDFARFQEIDTPQETWFAPGLSNSWVDYGLGFNTTGYFRDSNGLVHIRGLIKSGTTTAGTLLFTLSAGNRPATECIFATRMSGPAACEIRVQADGDVLLGDTGGNATWTCLDGICFDTR